MPDVNVPPTEATFYRTTARRFENVERGTRKAKRSKGEEVGGPFCVIGDMAVSTSGKYRVRNGGQILAVLWDSTDVGTGDTVFDVWVDGAAVGSTVTVPDTTTEDSYYIGNVRVSAGSKIQIDLTAAGMHPDAVIQVIMKG